MRGAATSITRAWLAMACFALAGTAHAQGELGARLEYTAALGCPLRADFEQRLRARMRTAASGSAMLRVRLEAPAHGSLRISEGERVVGERSLTAASCSDAADALAFVAALLLEEHAREVQEREAPMPPVQVERPARPARAKPRAVPDRAVAPHEAEPVALAPPDVVEPVVAPLAPPPAAPRSRAQPAPPTEARPAARRPIALDGWLAVGALLATGVTPAPRPGLDVYAGIGARRAKLRLAAAVGARSVLPHDERSAQGDAQFRWSSATLQLCAGLRVLAACLDAELGRIHAEGRATDAPRQRNASWYALGPSLRARVPVWGKLSLLGTLALPVPLTRDRFVVGTASLHRVPPGTFRASLALALEFE